MILSELIIKKQLTIVGLNSGTSADGVDLAALTIEFKSKSAVTPILRGGFRRYPKALSEKLAEMSSAELVSLDDLIYLDNRLGQFFGKAAKNFIERLRSDGLTVDAIASHGQTIRHRPKKIAYAGGRVNGSLQLGSAEQIATITGLAVVSDFRQADIALGNEGAPITVAAMGQLFSHPKEARLIVNIGGMSNFFYLPAKGTDRPVGAADCGPGNSLSDALTQQLMSESYDKNGRYARQGEISVRLLSMLMRHSFFKTKIISTGKEEFGADLTEEIISFGNQLSLPPVDLIATVAEMTVRAIGRTVGPIIKRDRSIKKLYLTGGGVHNKFFLEQLNRQLQVEVTTIKELGFNPDLVEAASFALMGGATLRSQALPTRFGQKNRQRMLPVLGKISQPPFKDN